MTARIEGAGDFTPAEDGDVSWVEHLRTAHLSVGTYSIASGGQDPQDPHTEDEIYVVTCGSATLIVDGRAAPAPIGAVLFVSAGCDHRFVDIEGDFATVVIFAPPEGTSATPQPTRTGMEDESPVSPLRSR